MAKNLSIDIDWSSVTNHILLNPALPKRVGEALYAQGGELLESLLLDSHLVVSTSGSTASSQQNAKLVALAKSAFLTAAQAVNRRINSDQQDRWILALPLFHVGGLAILARAHLSGASIVAWPSEKKWDSRSFVKFVEEQRGTVISLVPTQVFDLVQSQLVCPPSVREVLVGGGALAQELYDKAFDLGWPLRLSYGMTETTSMIALSDSPPQVALQKLEHVELAVNEKGFLKIRSQCLLTAYAQRQDEQLVIWDPKQDGWFVTADRCELVPEFKILGREQDIVKIGGELVNVADLRSRWEKTVLAHNLTEIYSTCLVAVEDSRLGFIIALVVEKGAPNLQNVIDDFAKQVLPFERIRKTLSVDKIPRTDLGKVQWFELNKLIGD